MYLLYIFIISIKRFITQQTIVDSLHFTCIPTRSKLKWHKINSKFKEIKSGCKIGNDKVKVQQHGKEFKLSYEMGSVKLLCALLSVQERREEVSSSKINLDPGTE